MDYLKVAEDARGLLARMATLAAVADAFAQVGTLEQAGREAQAVYDAIQPKLQAAKDELAKANEDVAAATTEAKLIRSTAKAAAADTIKTAQDRAVALKAEMDAMVETARSSAQQAAQQTQETLVAGMAAKDELDAECKALQAKLETLKSQAAALLA